MKSGFLAVLLMMGFISCAHTFELASSEVKEGKAMSLAQEYKGFGCNGGNLSPVLSWKNAPKDTRSFAVTVYDPDAPTGSGWWHWVVYDLPANVTSLPGGAVVKVALPEGAKQGRNDFGERNFGGACPPAGDKPHRYVFTVYALKVDKLAVPEDASSALIGYMLNGNSLGKAQLTATYARK
jgi:Raf kinase inhibitor-like YbhB/YbcL family protein